MRIKEKEIVGAARRILRQYRGLHGPSDGALLPDWCRVFTLAGLAHSNPEQVLDQQDRLFQGQTENGRLPLPTEAQADARYSDLCWPPIFGILLWLTWSRLKDKAALQSRIADLFDRTLLLHDYWYTHRDPAEEGLPFLLHPLESLFPQADYWEKHLAGRSEVAEAGLQEVAHLSLLSWANEAMIQLGGKLNKDLTDLLLWSELTVFSFNDKLWNTEYETYFSYDLAAGRQIPSGSLAGFLPLIAEVPDHDRAEALRATLERNFIDERFYLYPTQSFYAHNFLGRQPHRGANYLLVNWLLFYGFLRFDFDDLAIWLRLDTLSLVAEYGFYPYYESRKAELGNRGLGPGNDLLSAALTLDLINARFEHPGFQE